MAFHLIGLGLNKSSISADALEILKTCDKIYVENYTVKFPYSLNDLGFDFEKADRDFVESEEILKEADEKKIALLVYGDALSATTHMQLISACKKKGIECKVFHNASILTAVGECGLSLYKFGKTASVPNWKEHTNKPTSFMEILKDNESVGAHTLMLVDIGLDFENLVRQLRDSDFDLERLVVVMSCVGLNSQKIYFGGLDKINNVDEPFCLIVPGKMSGYEEEALESLKD